MDQTTTSHDVRHATPTECWELLASGDIGRVAMIVNGSVDIFPVNFLVRDNAIFFSSAPGSKLINITQHPEVTFEADGINDRKRWSVVAKGTAARLMFDAQIEESGAQYIHSLTPADKFNYVRITPTSLTGRIFRKSRRAKA